MSEWWVHSLYHNQGAMALVSWIFWIIFSICLHELAHGWTAIWQGDNTPRYTGHMTLNPAVHMGGWSLIMFALVGIAWGAMPVDPSRFRWRRKGDMLVSAAGPAMNVLLAFISLTAAALWNHYHRAGNNELHINVMTFCWLGGMLNLYLAAFNLLPVPPLDGSHILKGMSRGLYRFYERPEVQMYGMFVFMVIFMSGIGSVFVTLASEISHAYIRGLGSLLP